MAIVAGEQAKAQDVIDAIAVETTARIADVDAEETARINAISAEVTARNAAIAVRVPSGLIVMWHGTIGNIPSGWVLCTGGSGTPNLLARFVQGVATAGTNPGATGGATSKTTGSSSSSTSVDSRDSSPSSVSPRTHTHQITDIRPKFYDIAYLMKT